ncbi:MAG: T9SS type A sorting domain-containing protein [bacterium]
MKKYILILYILFVNSLFAANYFVAPWGNDGYSGLSWDSAFASLQHAADIVAAGDSVFAESGGYDVWLLKIAPDTFAVEETRGNIITNHAFSASIMNGPLLLPEGKDCRVFDITGRVVVPEKTKPGIYFIEINGKITRKVVKIR